MDFRLSEELQMLRTNFRRFVNTEMIPVERETTVGQESKPERRKNFERRAKDLGIWMMDVPEEFGGAGLNVLARVIIWEELACTIALPSRTEGFGPTVCAILYNLEGEMREKYLLPVLRGEKRSCFSQTEHDAGSDPGSMRTMAVCDGQLYVINGVKCFICFAERVDFAQVMAATDRDKGSRGGISCFIVDMDQPGVKVTTKYETMMDENIFEITFEDVWVPVKTASAAKGRDSSSRRNGLGSGASNMARELLVSQSDALSWRRATLRNG